MFSLRLHSAQKLILRELEKEAYIGHQTPNPLLFSVDGNTSHRLLDWARGSRPLVVNFGSCTCPVFMARLREFGETVEKFTDVADFLTVYIEEAHPRDEWSLKNNMLDIPQHTTQEERCKAAQILLDSGILKTPLVVDAVCNSASKAFAALPNRLYIVQDEKIQYAGGVGPTFYKPAEITKWLENCDLSDPNNNNPDKIETI